MWLARHGVPVAAILMPTGFFLSVLSSDADPAIGLVFAGGLFLVGGVVTLGIGLLRAPRGWGQFRPSFRPQVGPNQSVITRRADMFVFDPTYPYPAATERLGASTEWLRRAVRDGEGSASTSGENAARWYSAAARALSGGA